MKFRNVFFSNSRSSHGWSKSSLILSISLFLLTPYCAFAQSESTPQTISLSEKFLIAIAGILLAHALIPFLKHLANQRSIKKSYLAYLVSNIKSSLKRFGSSMSPSMARASLDSMEYSDWLEMLERSGEGVPDIFPQIHNLLHKSLVDNGENRYKPYISYSGMPVTELDHDHPIWLLKEDETKIISNFLLSQEQIERSVNELYTEPFFELSKSSCQVKHRQWVMGGFKVLDEMAEHFINTQRLRSHLHLRYKFSINDNGQ